MKPYCELIENGDGHWELLVFDPERDPYDEFILNPGDPIRRAVGNDPDVESMLHWWGFNLIGEWSPTEFGSVAQLRVRHRPTRVIVAFDPFESGDFDGTDRGITEAEAQRANEFLCQTIESHLPHINYTLLPDHLVGTWRKTHNRPYVAMSELEHYGLADEILPKLEDIYQETRERLGAEVIA